MGVISFGQDNSPGWIVRFIIGYVFGDGWVCVGDAGGSVWWWLCKWDSAWAFCSDLGR